ncbi:MAG: LysM peptidoglycan-binding domain-containing protein, partial [Eubacterium sp.]|nr:LysM peptidoglycan-binding domain-containing protein [Eubacterium sp.]
SANIDGVLVTERKLVDVPLKFNGDFTAIDELYIKLKSPAYKNGAILTTVDAVAIVNTDDGLSSVSTSADIEIPAQRYDEAIVSLCVDDYDFSLSADGRVDLRLNLLVNAYYYNVVQIPLLSDITVGDEIKDSHTLTVYFGKENENVWDIAKSFLSDADKIMKENSLKSDVLDASKVLIIPRA